MKHSRKANVGWGLGALAVTLAALIFVFGGTLLNGYGKAKAQQAFAHAHPGCALQLGQLKYFVGGNRLMVQSVAVISTNITLTTGPFSLTGVRWSRLLYDTSELAEALAHARLDATNLEVRFPRVRYGIRCARLQASVARSELIVQGAELRTLVTDEEFFASQPYRATRFTVRVPECEVLGLSYGDLLQGKSYRAASVHFSQPSFDALVSRERPPDPFERPRMVHEALAALPLPLQIDRLNLTNGHLTYRERVVAGAAPGVLTFGAVAISAEGIANRAEPHAAIVLRAWGDLMEAARLEVWMSIPISPPAFSLRYSGSLGAMDLTRLDAFLDIAEHTRIKSGVAQEVNYAVEVINGEARGQVRAIYRELEIAVLSKHGAEQGLRNRVESFLANEFKIRRANAPEAAGSMKEGEVSYTRRPQDEFMQFIWFSLRSGVLDLISK